MSSHTKRIGLLVHNTHDAYSTQILAGLRKFCLENDFQLTDLPVSAINAGKFGFEYRHNPLIQLVNKNNFDGLVVSTGSITSFMSEEEINALFMKFKDIPVVSLGIDVPGIPCVQVKTELPFKSVVRHVITKHKKKNFLLVKSNSETFDSNIRTKWFMDVLDEFDIEIDSSHIINGEFNASYCYPVIKEYLNKNGLDFNCAVCLNDEMAMAVIHALEDFGYKIPKDVVVTGYDNSPTARFSAPALTTCDPQIEQQAYKAGTILKQILNGEKTPHNNYLPGKEKFRCSCGCVKPDDYMTESIDSKGNVSKYPEKLIMNIIQNDTKRYHDQLHTLHYIMSYSIAVKDRNDFKLKLPKILDKTDIHAFAINIYDEPVRFKNTDEFTMPDNIKCIFSFEKKRKEKVSMKTTYYNPKKNVIAPKIFDNEYNFYIGFSIFANDLQYGYLIAAVDTLDFMFFEVLFETISKQITSELELNAEQKISKQLVTKNSNLEKYSSMLNVLSNTDELTQINNRRGFLFYANKIVSQAADSRKFGMVIYGDMDGLKKINDTWGHEFGDRAIKACADILTRVSRQTDVVGRLSGDEFSIIAKGMTPETFKTFKKRIEEECDKFNKTSNEPFRLSISLGCTTYSKDSCDIAKLLSQADASLYKEKMAKKAAHKH